MLPVAIVGGGPVGLVSSILLSMRKIPHQVFEQFPGTSIHPKACGLNQRTIEIFRHIGVEEEIKKHRAPLEIVGRTGWFTGVGPQSREIFSRDSWGGGKYENEYLQASPVQYSTLAQIRLEPILQQRALELNPAGIRYQSKVTSVREQRDHVSLEVARKDGQAEEVKAKFVIGADGGRGLAESLGIGWKGERDIVDMVTAHFKADLTSIHPDPRIFISWLINPRLQGSLGAGYLYHLGPYYPQRAAKEEWVLAAPRSRNDPVEFDNATMIDRIRCSLEIPDLDVDLLSLSQWTVNARVTESYRSRGGRVFLAGDACHRVPPWGALGMNSGVQDAFNLIWKLALAIKSNTLAAYSGLLDTYEEERKPIAVRVAQNSLKNMRSHANVMDHAVGINADTTTEQNLSALAAYFDPTHPENSAKREAVRKASGELDHEFHAPGIEIGWFYPSADINNEGVKTRHGGQIKEDGSFNSTQYCPSTIPGHHVPHAWLVKGDKVVSTRDLIQLDRFVLFTQTSGVWDRAANNDIAVHTINGEADNWSDRDGTWARLCGVEKDGAVLMRPDGIVAWRADSFSSKLLNELPSIIDRILKRA
ncbi:hypothetical protein PV08_11664 [Exophiala spinifera]|uniref:FAD-binding domain-containing protein n=1 Tax=Exophiala spinifera TaxID=91928 RepID=A0A0D2AW48_9EURO|nr:uncharacterized protein PV08_11664 [Exophiala spinifera]KIW10700.1 hypothetical protein PV08_11664 [Exophiala spinifera]